LREPGHGRTVSFAAERLHSGLPQESTHNYFGALRDHRSHVNLKNARNSRDFPLHGQVVHHSSNESRGSYASRARSDFALKCQRPPRFLSVVGR